jgi:hypothetical protein
MNAFQTVSVVVGGAAAAELLALGGLFAARSRVKRRERQIEQLWDRHRRAVERDVAYLHEWQDFLGSLAGEVSEDERG